ncbi:MAG: acetyl-CoA carboxylase biotin carboxyl carrier protein [Hyphomicrobiales bacterium]|nr:acetyl-CoA carboxylase biotin carboxyl carrier protein [Hyphomicrobiales bacterium]MDE2016419.1 acetyl-CoA carboxylase biotin carboxyl carrier protein [Hyphomicrobiales bacterium]
MKKPAAAPTKDAPLDAALVEALARIAAEHDLSEAEVEHDGLRVRVARERRAATVIHAAPMAAPVAASAVAPAAPAGEESGTVKSPMIGTAYLRPSPEAKPFVEIGMAVKAGERILLVEAMKTFNDIVAPHGGVVTKIFVEDGTPVEYGQPLMVIA